MVSRSFLVARSDRGSVTTERQLPERPPRARPYARTVRRLVRREIVRRSRPAEAPVVRRPRMVSRVRPRLVDATDSSVLILVLLASSSASGGEAAGALGLSPEAPGGADGAVGGGAVTGGAPLPWHAREPKSVKPPPAAGMNCQS